MSDLTDDLQDYLTDIKKFGNIDRANLLIERSLAALSPVLPDDVARDIDFLRNLLPNDDPLNKALNDTADLLERQARENTQLRDACGNNQQSIVMVRNHYEQRIEELQTRLDYIGNPQNGAVDLAAYARGE